MYGRRQTRVLRHSAEWLPVDLEWSISGLPWTFGDIRQLECVVLSASGVLLKYFHPLPMDGTGGLMNQSLVPAAQYLRMSTDHQQYSLDNQADAIAQYAAQHGFQVVKTY